MSKMLLAMSAIALITSLPVRAEVGAADPSGWRCKVIVNKVCETQLDRDHRFSSASVGDIVECTIYTFNASDCDLEDVKIKDFLPRNVDFVYASGSPVHNSDSKVVWKTNLSPGDNDTFTLKYRVEGPSDRRLDNKVCASHSQIETDCDEWDMYVIANGPVRE